MKDLDQAVEAFWQARRGGPYPLHWEPQLDQDIAYRINLALVDRHAGAGEPQCGWKVGLTARAIREQFGLPEPVFAVLFDHGRWESPAEHALSDLEAPGWENELCLRVGETLRGPGVTEDAARAAVATVAPAMEIIETRGPNSLDGLYSMTADNGQQRAFVVGPETPFDPARHDLGATSVDVFIDGTFQERAYGSAVMESSPIASLVWLADKLSAYDRAIEAGQVVMTGSFTKQYRIDRPMRIEARYDPFGSAIATFT